MTITKGIELGQYLDNVINETLHQTLQQNAIDEKDKQSAAGQAQTKTNSGSDDDSSSTDFDSMKDDDKDSMSDDADAMKGDVKIDDVVEKLNTIRSGKSFKDSLVQQRFDEYFSSLDDAEKVAMFAFLKGIAQIVTGEVDADQAAEPSDKPADVKMKKGPDIKTKKIKPQIIKKPAPGPEHDKPKVSKGGGEDTSAPIQVKKR